jgi:glyoxylase-like metal-dependent hydrolase (beta-lactamase superfamily II)
LLITIGISVLLVGFVGNKYTQPTHFTLQTLEPGIYAAIAKADGHAICNAGVIDMGNYLLVFDAFMTPNAARELRTIVESTCGKPVRYLVNSHWHNDHTGGNQVFADVKILGTEAIRMGMHEKLPDEINSYPGFAPQAYQALLSTDTKGFSSFDSVEHRLWCSYFGGLVEAMDNLRLTLPDSTITTPCTLKGDRRTLVLLNPGSGHTSGDLVLWLPREKILFSGDLIFNENHPWLGDGNVDTLLKALQAIEKLQPERIIPGHGPVCGPEATGKMRLYIETLRNEATAASNKKISADSLKNLPIPEAFRQWHLQRFYTSNLRLIYSGIK